jgi:hypothetical protein
MTSATDQDRVFDGTAFLDNYGPENWDQRINVDKLDMCDTTNCVLGQLYGSFFTGRNSLGLDTDGACELGFDTYLRGQDHNCAEYTAAWKETINTRRALAMDH